jgi:hypothetical protein
LNPTSKPLSAQQEQHQQQQFKAFKQNQTRKFLTKNLELQSPMFYQLVSRAGNERESSLPHTFFFSFLINQTHTHTHTHTKQKNSFQTLKGKKKQNPPQNPRTPNSSCQQHEHATCGF